MTIEARRSGQDGPGISGDGGDGAEGVVDLSLERFLATQARAPEDLAQALVQPAGATGLSLARAGPPGPSGPGMWVGHLTLSFRRPGSPGPTAMANCQLGLCAALMG